MTTILRSSYVQIGDLVLASAEDSGVEWHVERLDGWGSPASTVQSVQRPRAHGGWSGEAWLRPRAVSVGGVVVCRDPLQLSLAVDRLLAAVDLDATALTVVEDGRARWCLVRRSDEVQLSELGPTAWRWAFQVVADDPRKYGAQQSRSTALPSTVGGLTAPITAPITSDAVTASGIVSIVNEGNVEAPLTIRFAAGPSGLLGPSVTHVQSGRTWAAAGAQLVAGEFWELQQPSLQVLAMGQSSRAGYVSSRGRFELRPGPNDFVFGADMYVPDAQMTVTASSAWK